MISTFRIIDVVAKVIERCDFYESSLLLDDGQLSRTVWNNRLVLLEAIKKGWSVLVKVEPGSPLLDDAELVRLAIKECGPSELRFASWTLKNDRDFIHSVVYKYQRPRRSTCSRMGLAGR